ncbi:MAG: imidazole glycerol phosphate synthase subunit HisH [Candidatus Omnitrophica bacterium]|nr:imidazole glycerol phosphate synthase subunit HisH [Candidatus Omnitrophota bacterium]
MPEGVGPRQVVGRVAIVDYGMGNLFSVKHACEAVGLSAAITSSSEQIVSANAVILPGVGAFGDAMEALRRLDLISPLRDAAVSGAPLMGICLGMQLLMSESEEFGRHKGLGIIEGDVVRLAVSTEQGRVLKVPHIGWNRIERQARSWDGSLLEGLTDGSAMYFVHSFYLRPVDPRVVLSVTRYGSTTFCSTLQQDHVFASQYHPERSGPLGLRMYRRLAARITAPSHEVQHAEVSDP